MSNKSILLICFDFPPNDGIGGRRWAKFAKYLAKNGCELYVIKAQTSDNNSSPWLSDVSGENIKVYPLPHNFPKSVMFPNSKIWNRLKYKFDLWKLKKKGGTPFDYSKNWESKLLNKARELVINHDIKNVIATGAPFRVMVYASRLKKQFPGLNLIVDYRDPWITSPIYGMPSLSPSDLLIEKKLQQEVFEMADYVIAPNKFILDEIKNTEIDKNRTHSGFIEVSHAYDLDDIRQYLEKEDKSKEDKIKLVYGGAIYPGMDSYLENLSKWLTDLKKRNLVFYQRISIKFYTNQLTYEELFSDHKEVVQFQGMIGKKIFEEVKKCDFLIILLAEFNKNSKTTKFMEFLPFRKPIIFIGANGYVSDFITTENLGFVVKNFDTTFEDYILKKPNFNNGYDHSQFEFNEVTQKIINLLNG